MKRIFIFMFTLAFAALLSAPALAGEEKCEDKSCGFKFGGFFKTDLIYDNARAYPGNYHLYVPAYGDDDSNEFFLTARESRMSFDFWWKDGDYKTTGYLEFDFQNVGGGENKAAPMLRHAYFKTGKGNWSVLAGQTWDIISPLNPKTANYSVLWYQGNIGYRRPQVRFSTWAEAGENGKIKLDAGVSRNIGNDLDENSVDDGADAGLPAFQGRLCYATKYGEGGKFGIGFSGHYGQEAYEDDREDVTSWSLNADLVFAFSKKFSIMGEYFAGENLGQYFGGIGQNLNPERDPLPTKGGWGMISFKPRACLMLNAGFGFDDPDEEEWNCPGDGETYTMMDLNTSLFANIFFDVNKNVTAIFEVSKLNTEYLDRTNDGVDVTDLKSDFDDVRIQFALKCAIK